MSAVPSAKHVRAVASPYLRRLMGAAVLDRVTYEEIEADENATMQVCALGWVLAIAMAIAIGAVFGPSVS